VAFSGFHGTTAAVLVPKGRALAAAPLFERGPKLQLKSEGKRGRPLAAGELVIIEPAGIARRKERGRQVTSPVARIVRRIGHADNASDVIEALMVERGLERRFPGKVENHARKAAEGNDHFARKDMTGLATFTMDPSGAKDFDDAISAVREGEDIRVWVHIADVSAFVRPGDPVDCEARHRATSVYVPGAVEPMLPEALSNDACSLVPGELRQVVTAELLFRGSDCVESSFTRGLIRSDARLTYDQVDQIFAGQSVGEEPWAGPLALAREVAAALQERREGRKALELESSEPAFEFDDDGAPTEVHAEQQTESHRVIEHMMIAANEAVARYLQQRHAPTLFRIHERPDVASVERLTNQLESLGIALPPIPENFTGEQAEGIIGEISAAVASHVRRTGKGRAAFTSLVLRSLKQARYAPQNLGHSGLRSPNYCHFTSPIRRYPDLLVHRALLAELGLDDAAPSADRLAEDAEWTSAREREASKIERRADDIVRTFLLEDMLKEAGWNQPGGTSAFKATSSRPSANRNRAPKFAGRDQLREGAQKGPVFSGEIVGLIGGGMFVQFGPHAAFEGFVPLRELKNARGGYWDLNLEETALIDRNGGQKLALGDSIEVAVLDLQPARGRVDLLPVSS
jgi:ribonuclease R